MRKLAHISDLHFGRTDAAVVDRLSEKIHALGPDLIVVSGDLTQRARRREFEEACDFLSGFDIPRVVVPGNHDVPVFNIFERATRPFARYDKYFSKEQSFYQDEEMVVVGINTVRSLAIKEGRVNAEQVEWVREKMCHLDERMLKVVVTHHPFDLPGEFDDRIVGRAGKMMPLLVNCGADLFLAGHLHLSSVTNSAHRYKLASGRSALIVQAGTAASTRGRGEPNSFNVIEHDGNELAVTRFECSDAEVGFLPAAAERFSQGPAGWERV